MGGYDFIQTFFKKNKSNFANKMAPKILWNCNFTHTLGFNDIP